MRRIILLVFLALSTAAYGQQQSKAAATTATTTTAAEAASTSTNIVATDSNEIRARFRELLERMPPQVGVILKLDPTLFGNQQFLSTYPALEDFVKRHPEVPHNPAFYLAYVGIPSDSPARTNAQRMWEQTMEGIFFFAVFATITSVIVWFLKTVIEQRRWSRLSRIQTEVHGKLLDRFASSEELLRYIETPAGKRFLESAPIPVDTGTKQVSAPIGRILWSVQTGLVVAAAGVGLQWVSSGVTDRDAAQPLHALGVVALCVGIGFVISAVVSFILSRRLHLLETEPQGPANV
jgi:hypothetical protein